MERGQVIRIDGEELFIEGHVRGRYVAATMRNLLIFYWASDGTIDGTQLLASVVDKQTANRTRRASAIHVIHQRVGLPDGAVRAALQSNMARYAEVTACLGIIMLGAGFWASALQSALTGIRMVAPTGSSVMRFGQTPESVVPWFAREHAERTGALVGASSLLTAIALLQRAGEEGTEQRLRESMTG